MRSCPEAIALRSTGIINRWSRPVPPLYDAEPAGPHLARPSGDAEAEASSAGLARARRIDAAERLWLPPNAIPTKAPFHTLTFIAAPSLFSDEMTRA